ncbi:hypothetical protein HPB51_005917 [Rhipicephalus microplus]|uniref:Conserved oligomeric Golgi complex subunit 3 C-terminal domain-containing protein n=1 Tax=Rhipicephalus microplus TaxID=6941 RepID=A0A9J6D3T4_RHIMP|nr:hypothetical protein HPB51_005917 [Rhipicephalus microplus]
MQQLQSSSFALEKVVHCYVVVMCAKEGAKGVQRIQNNPRIGFLRTHLFLVLGVVGFTHAFDNGLVGHFLIHDYVVIGVNERIDDLHGMWYPTVRRTLVCLSKLYRCVDKTIFQGLSQEVLAACIESLSAAGKEISKNKANIDGELFQIKHLLILREQIAPFQIDFAIKETSLDFTRIKDAALSLYNKKSRLFSLGTNNALLEFVLEGTLSIKENLIDSKKAVDNQLKALCEEFIANSARTLIGPLQDFLDKANLILQVKQQEPTRTVSLRNQPFAAPDSVSTVVSSAYRHLKSSLNALARSMSLYLANKDTEQILFKPIKTKVLASYENLNQIVRTTYSAEDQQIIACPSVEQYLTEPSRGIV